MITVTENAVKQLQRLLSEHDPSMGHKGLRLSVTKGGCAGMKYHIELDSPDANDTVLQQEGAAIYIDPDSQRYLEGCIVDYEASLSDTGFKIENPNASRNCECGSSFEPKEIHPTLEPSVATSSATN